MRRAPRYRGFSRVLGLVGGLLFALCARAAAPKGERISDEHVVVSFLAPTVFGAGEQTVGVLFQPQAGWHVYWKNPGDSGTAVKFALSGNATFGDVAWPAPTRLPYAHLTNLGYDKAVAFPVALTPLAGAKNLHVEVKLEWLVCDEGECVPGFGTLVLERPVGAEAVWQAAQKAELASFVARVPRVADGALVQRAAVIGNELVVTLAPGATAPEIFPIDGDFLLARAPVVETRGDSISERIPLAPGAKIPATTGFVIVDHDRINEITAHVTSTPIAATPAAEPLAPLWILLLSAFFGGLLLNLMPCVLPVLSIKFMSLAKDANDRRLRDALAYALGVVVTFAALGGGVIALKAAGSSVGWGFQLQSPVVVLALITLFWLMALNFLGVFEIGFGTMNLANRAQSSSSFATGMLSVFVAAPCTGPFMGSALGATAVLSPLPAMAIFVCLGLGLASPFVVLGLSPRLLAKLPKPGAWMERLKQFFAFPLFATVLWLLWVLGMQTGTSGWVAAGALLLLLAFCLWLGRGVALPLRATAWVLAIAGTIGIVAHVHQLGAPAAVTAAHFVPYEKARVDAARKKGQPVFIDFTAAWCITCQVNKQAVLETAAATALFAQHDVLTVAADWTNRDAMITVALAEFGRNSVPLYVYYPPAGPPQVLPQLLRLSMIEEALAH